MARLTIALPPRGTPAGRRGDAIAGTGARARALAGRLSGWRGDRGWLAPLLSLFLFKQLLLVAIIGPFTGHDEVDHFWYIARLARGDGLGEVGRVELPPEAEPFKEYVADYPNNAEVIQPPLYHALLAPLWRLVPGDVWDKLYALRLMSVGLGMAVVWLGYLTARLMFPDDLLMRAGVPIFVALQPQFSFEAAIVNHDVLVIFLFSLVVLLLLVGLRDGFSTRRELAISLVVAAGLWTKLSFALVLPVVGLAVGLAWRDRRRQWGDAVASVHWLLGSVFLTVGLPLLLLSPWLVRSYVLYGDPSGASRLQEIGDFGASASTYRQMLGSSRFWEERLADFWSNYGWRHIPFEPEFNYLLWFGWGLLLTVSLVVLIQEVLSVWFPVRPTLGRFQRRGLALLSLSVLSLGFGVLYVGTIQFTQSRFIFPAMIGIAAMTLIGVDRVLSVRARPVALTILIALLVLVNVVSAIRFLIPFYYGPGRGGISTVSVSASVDRRRIAVAVAGGLLLIALASLFVPIEVRNSEPFGRSSTFDRPRSIAVRGGYITPNYDNLQRVDLDLRAYSVAARYDLTVHVRPSGAESVEARSVLLNLDTAAIWHQKEAFADPYVTVRFPPIEKSAGQRFYVWVEAGPRNRDDIWTLWSIKSFSRVRAGDVLAALIDSPPEPIQAGGEVVLILLIVGTVGSAVWLTAVMAAFTGARESRRPTGEAPESVAPVKG